MPTINTLTDSKCRAARPSERARKLFDGGGLYLFVSPAGAKTWRLAYRLDGVQKTKSFGPYPEVTLAVAREKRDAVKAQLRDGVDPMQIRRSRVGLTLRQASEKYWGGRGDVSTGYRKNAERAIEMHLLPTLGARDVSTITREQLLDALNVMDAAGRHVYVRKTRMWVGQVFDWAVEHKYASMNPAAQINPKKAFGRAVVAHFSALEQRDMPEFLERLALEDELSSALACRLLALTWVRTTELRKMRWEEIEGDTWRVPSGRMKKRSYHLVPLSPQAVAIIEKMRARCRGSVYVFPAENRLDRSMSENAILYLLYRMGFKGRMTGHGWRTVASTWANERGYTPDAIERQLAHAPDDQTRAAYNRAAYLPERRTMLLAWADWIDSQNPDASIVQSR